LVEKKLREYFSDCPKMIENINNGLYNFENKETYIKMFDDYTAYAVINKINTRSKLPVRVAFFVF
jgi:hypothetical protein